MAAIAALVAVPGVLSSQSSQASQLINEARARARGNHRSVLVAEMSKIDAKLLRSAGTKPKDAIIVKRPAREGGDAILFEKNKLSAEELALAIATYASVRSKLGDDLPGTQVVPIPLKNRKLRPSKHNTDNASRILATMRGKNPVPLAGTGDGVGYTIAFGPVR